MQKRSKLIRRLTAFQLALVAAFATSADFSFAQEPLKDKEKDKEQEEAQRRQFLFSKFLEVGKKYEAAQNYVMAVGMYEAALDKINGQEQYVTALTLTARCYRKLGYFWRTDTILEKLTAAIKQNPSLLTTTVIEAFNSQIELLQLLKRENEAAKCLENLSKLQALLASKN